MLLSYGYLPPREESTTPRPKVWYICKTRSRSRGSDHQEVEKEMWKLYGTLFVGCFGFWPNTQPRPFQKEHAGGRTFLKNNAHFFWHLDWLDKIWNWLKPFPNHSKSYMGAIPHVIPNHRKVEQRLRLEAEDALAEVRRESHDSWKEVM